MGMINQVWDSHPRYYAHPAGSTSGSNWVVIKVQQFLPDQIVQRGLTRAEAEAWLRLLKEDE